MNATEKYHELVQTILDKGKPKTDRTGTGTITIPSYSMEFDMADGFPLITSKKIHTKSVIHELLWFLKGDTNIKYLNDNGVTIWDEWADSDGELGPVYGSQWRKWVGNGKPIATDYEGNVSSYLVNNIDQIQTALDKLRNNPTDRGNLVSAWNVGELDKMALRPCHWAFQLITEELSPIEICEQAKKDGLWVDTIPEGKTLGEVQKDFKQYRLHLKWHQRSQDLFLGSPYNIACYALLLHMFAQQANMVPGTLYGNLSEVHIYNNHISYIKEQIKRDSNKYSSPTLKLNKAKDIFSYKYEDFIIENYEAYPNWKNVPVAV